MRTGIHLGLLISQVFLLSFTVVLLANHMQHYFLPFFFSPVGMADIWFHPHAAISTEGCFC